MLLHRIARVVIGGFAKVFSSWLRGLLVVVGLLTIVLSVFVFIYSALVFLILVFILSITFLLNGIARTVSGITGIRLLKLARVSRNTYLARAKK
ncbi:MAG: hypothetical protein OEY39_02960 [Candidatus Bathyarchaeota archaeon]|nr:hypothetical protein [Candidatus Bathyarchaeota archaeon]